MACKKDDEPANFGTYGGWLPKDPSVVDRYVKRLIEKEYKTTNIFKIEKLQEEREIGLVYHSAIKNLKDLIESDPEVFKFFNLMFTQVPHAYRQIPGYRVLLGLLNIIISIAPPFYASDLVGVPIMGILLRPMITPAGTNAFMNDKVNKAFKEILSTWCVFLKSLDSRYVLSDDDGWLSPDALKLMPNFEYLYECNPDEDYWGFKSWDDFFTRTFKPRRRPVAQGDDVIANACESAPLFVKRDVQLRDKFWIKEQPYCLEFMLAGDKDTESFVGGTVYQAFLSQFNYHRWHSPIDGTIVRARVVDGSYYAESFRAGYHTMGNTYSQCYISSTATRALLFIKADNPHLGLVCFVAIGMAEVSSCDITTYEGAHVTKGEQTGMFHFGGSSHCLVFQRGVDVRFEREPEEPDFMSEIMPVNAKIGTVYHD